MTKKNGILLALVAAGLLLGFVWGALASFWALERYVVRKDSETHSLYVAANACIALKAMKNPDALSGILDQQLEAGLLALACDDRLSLSQDNIHLLSQIKGFVRERPLHCSSPDSRAKIAEFLKAIPD